MKKAIWFDMDGTIADLYGVENWLYMLENEIPYPYEYAKPLVNLSRLARYLNKLQKNGYTIGIISWLSKRSSPMYDRAVTAAKREWLSRHLPSVHWDEIHIVAYGTNKYETCGDGILFDDEEKNRTAWLNDCGFSPETMFDILKAL